MLPAESSAMQVIESSTCRCDAPVKAEIVPVFGGQQGVGAGVVAHAQHIGVADDVVQRPPAGTAHLRARRTDARPAEPPGMQLQGQPWPRPVDPQT